MELIDRIVAEVMSQLRNEPAAATDANVANENTSAFVLAGRVITGDMLAEQAGGRSRIHVQPNALLTPSAKDWLKKHKVELTRAAGTRTTTQRTALPNPPKSCGAKLLIVVHDGNKVAEAVIDELLRNSSTDQTTATSAETAAAFAVESIKDVAGKRVIVFTEKTHWVACLGNRNEAVRAATVNSVAEVEGVLSVMNGNVFAINVHGRSFFELRNLVRAISK